MLKTVVFDLGNVLVFFSHPKMFQQVAQCTGLNEEIVQKIFVDEGIQKCHELGKINNMDVYNIFQARSPRFFSLNDLLEAISAIFTPNTTLFPIVEELKEKGLRLVLLSNTSECHFNYISTHYSVLSLFDEHVLSYQIGALKPSLEIFQKTLLEAQCEPKDCFYTDDILEFVIEAKKMGLDSELFTGVLALKTALRTRGLLLA